MNLAPQFTEADPLQFLVNSLPQLVWIAEPDGDVIFYNERVKEFAGAKQLPNGRWKWNGLLHPDDEADTVTAWGRAVATGTVYEKEHRVQMSDGSYRWHLSRGVPQFNESGELVNWFGTATDIHKQKLAEQQSHESEIQFRTLANSILQLAWIADANGYITWYNDRFFEYTGMTVDDLRQEGIRQQLHHPDHISRVLPFFEQAWKKGEPWELTFPLRGKDGRYRWFLTRAVPLKNQDGRVYRWLGTNTDVDEQISLSEKLELLVNERTRELQRSNDDLQQFAHVASHDLKEPIRKIRTFMNRLSTEFRNILPDRAQFYIDKIEGASERMYSMIEGVLMYSTINETNMPLEDVELNRIIQDITNDLEVVIQAKQARIEYTDLPVIHGFSLLIYQLFYNLLNNALKFAKSDVVPVVTITAKTSESSVQIFIKDNGIGFDDTDSKYIFKPFSRLNSKDQYEGTGLGLSLCQKIVERHKGTIKASGEKGKGATFCITLPL